MRKKIWSCPTIPPTPSSFFHTRPQRERSDVRISVAWCTIIGRQREKDLFGGGTRRCSVPNTRRPFSRPVRLTRKYSAAWTIARRAQRWIATLNDCCFARNGRGAETHEHGINAIRWNAYADRHIDTRTWTRLHPLGHVLRVVVLRTRGSIKFDSGALRVYTSRP